MARRTLEEIIASDPRFTNVNPAVARAYYEDAMAQRDVKNKELPELVVTAPKRKKKEVTAKDINFNISYDDAVSLNKESNPIYKTLEYGAKNFKHTFGFTPRDAGYFLPIIGDVQSAEDITEAVQNKDYATAATIAGLMAAPSVLRKPIKSLGRRLTKAVRNYKDALTGYNITRYNNTKNAINDLQELNNRTIYNANNDIYKTNDKINNIKWNIYTTNNEIERLQKDIQYNRENIRENAYRTMSKDPDDIIFYNIEGNTSNNVTKPIGFYKDELGNSTPITSTINNKPIYEVGVPPFDGRYSGIRPIHYKSIINPQYSPTPDLIPLLNEREKRLYSIIGDNGKLTGSSKLTQQGYISHIPGDDDIITTAARYNDLEKSLGASKIRSLRDDIGYLVSSPHLRGGQSDIDIIQETNGKAVGALAHELYQFMNPKEYAALRNRFSKKGAYGETLYFEDIPLPVSAEEIYSKLNDDIIGKKALSDLLFSHNDKHAQRRIQLFANKEKFPQIKEVINNKFNSLYGKDLNLSSSFKLDDVAANEKLLEKLNFDKSLAQDKDAMEIISKYVYLSNGSHTRRINPERLPSAKGTNDLNFNISFDDWINKDKSNKKSLSDVKNFFRELDEAGNATSSFNGGSGAGRGGNYTTGDNGGGKNYGPYATVTTDYIPDEIDNPYKLYKYLTDSDSKLSKNTLKEIQKEFPNFNGRNLSDVHYSYDIPYDATSNAKLADITGRKFSVGEYYNFPDLYIGRLKRGDLSSSNYSYRGFEHGRIQPRVSDQKKTELYNGTRIIDELRENTLAGNQFQRDYSKALKRVKKETKQRIIKTRNELNDNKRSVVKLEEDKKQLIERSDNLKELMENKREYSNILLERTQKLINKRDKQKELNKKIRRNTKIAAGTVGTITIGGITYNVLKPKKEHKSIED